jgi:hypothetical protein
LPARRKFWQYDRNSNTSSNPFGFFRSANAPQWENAGGDLEGCLSIEFLLQNRPKKKKVPMSFAGLGAFFIQFCAYSS